MRDPAGAPDECGAATAVQGEEGTDMTDRESTILLLRHKGMTLKAIGLVLGISPSRVRQIEHHALRAVLHAGGWTQT